MAIRLFQSGSRWLFEGLAGTLRTYQVRDVETRADDTYRLSEPRSTRSRTAFGLLRTQIVGSDAQCPPCVDCQMTCIIAERET
jgi:hypothetical protein